MNKEILTPELTEVIRTLRLQNKIQSKDLAKCISKSPAYISRLENGAYTSIDTEELCSLLKCITMEKNELNSISKIYEVLSAKYTAGEINNQLWLRNLDTVVINRQVSDKLIDHINDNIEKNRISRHHLIEKINSNDYLPNSEISNSNIPANHWYRHGNDIHSYIKIDISPRRVNDILDKKTHYATYSDIFSIIYYSELIKKYDKDQSAYCTTHRRIINKVIKTLKNYNFTLITDTDIPKNDILLRTVESFDKNISRSINSILKKIAISSTQNANSTNNQLNSFLENLNWDLGFMMSLISMNFKSLNKLSVSNRKRLLKEIAHLIEKYNQMDDYNNIEDYS